jgi:hypothetical protein
MPYKLNPQRSERVCSLGRKLRNMSVDFADTFSSQWLERTIDDVSLLLLLFLVHSWAMADKQKECYPTNGYSRDGRVHCNNREVQK